MPRVYRPDLTEHFILVHPGRQWGIVSFTASKARCTVASYFFDEDGTMRIVRRQELRIRDGSKGRYIWRLSLRAYIHDFIKPRANPYA
jgi:hypothetical protein